MHKWSSKSFPLIVILAWVVVLLGACLPRPPAPNSVTPTLAPPTHTPAPIQPIPSATPSPQAALPPDEQVQPMFRGGLAHTGVYANQGNYGEWLFTTDGPIGASPVLAYDTLYCGALSGTVLYALNPVDHQVKWRYTGDVGLFSSPAVTADRVLVGTLSGKLLALESATGEELWSFSADGPIISSPAVEGDSVYFATQAGQVYAVDLNNGQKLWSYPTSGVIQASPALSDGVLVIGSGDAFLYALDAASGQVKWLYLSEGPISSSAVIQDGMVYFGSQSDGNSFYAVDLQTGKARWKVKAGPLVSSPALVDGILYVGGVDGSVLAGKAADGSLVWAAHTGGLIISSPAVTDEAVYIGSSDGKLYAFERASGQVQWTYQTNGDIWSSPSVAGDTLFFGSGDRNLYAIDRHAPQLALAPTPTAQPLQPTPTMIPGLPPAPQTGTAGLPWWNDRVFYEVYVRSFYDSNGDGIGDLQGLIQKLDYLNDGDPHTATDLGVTGLWLMPVSESPSIHGYDASDFRQVEKDYGTNADFKQLVQEAHRRGMVVIVDMVMNHTSSENPWFQDAMQAGSAHENWYIWSPSDPGYTSPWGSQVWYQVPSGLNVPRAYHAAFDYYYALFSATQPDLNYRNGAVTQEMYDILRFWLEDMGADGFRLDAIRHLIEDGAVQFGTPETHAWLQGFYRYVHTLDPDTLTVGEIWQDTAQVATYVGDQVDMAFEFNLAQAVIDSLNQADSTPLVEKLAEVLSSYPNGQYATFLTNHDMARLLTQLKGSTDKAKLAGGLLLTQPGVPFIYYGEEIGLDGPLPDINVRLPMQWDASVNAGFTQGAPWHALSLNHEKVNVATEATDPDSLLSFYRQLIQLRQANAALRAGDTFVVHSSTPEVYGLLRHSGTQSILVVANLADQPLQGYQLALDSGPLQGRLKASVLFSSATLGNRLPATLAVNAQGGFTAYTPLVELPPLSLTVLQLAP